MQVCYIRETFEGLQKRHATVCGEYYRSRKSYFSPLSHRTTGNGACPDTGYDEYQIVILTDKYQIVILTDKY